MSRPSNGSHTMVHQVLDQQDMKYITDSGVAMRYLSRCVTFDVCSL